MRISVPDTNKVGQQFEIGCGTGPTKKEARKIAARVALKSILPNLYDEWK